MVCMGGDKKVTNALSFAHHLWKGINTSEWKWILHCGTYTYSIWPSLNRATNYPANNREHSFYGIHHSYFIQHTHTQTADKSSIRRGWNILWKNSWILSGIETSRAAAEVYVISNYVIKLFFFFSSNWNKNTYCLQLSYWIGFEKFKPIFPSKLKHFFVIKGIWYGKSIRQTTEQENSKKITLDDEFN